MATERGLTRVNQKGEGEMGSQRLPRLPQTASSLPPRPTSPCRPALTMVRLSPEMVQRQRGLSWVGASVGRMMPPEVMQKRMVLAVVILEHMLMSQETMKERLQEGRERLMMRLEAI